MKFKAVIIESIEPDHKNIIINFQGDKLKQHFEIECDFNPFELGMKKWAVWELNIKFKSEIFEDQKTKIKSYFTHLTCGKAQPVNQTGTNWSTFPPQTPN